MDNSADWRDRLAALLPDMDAPEQEPEQPVADEPAPKAVQTGRLDVLLDRKGRAGKTATIIAGFTCDDDTIAELASQLKRRLGVGGSCRGGEILVQGDRRDRVLAFLAEKGYKARKI